MLDIIRPGDSRHAALRHIYTATGAPAAVVRPQSKGALLAHLQRRDPRLRQEVRTQQPAQRGGVDLVVLEPGGGDGLALQWMHPCS
ncbi:hypothetical protein AB0M11_20765 [Streptomyces sp. NPDC051987]|uniref:hypothetical protein n=1 Tax=Streptomyces sp. NPDC051987 TaxID=3155808 RepID=UPI003425CE8B